jgi:hypothetical protein
MHRIVKHILYITKKEKSKKLTMSIIAILKHMVKDEEKNLQNVSGVNIVSDIVDYVGLTVEIKKVLLQSKYMTAWVMNDQSKKCMRCCSSFGVFKWKHHCRKCGYLVCNGCSSKRTLVPELKEVHGSRTCTSCACSSKQEEANTFTLKEEKQDSDGSKKVPGTPETVDSVGYTDSEASEESANTSQPDFTHE